MIIRWERSPTADTPKVVGFYPTVQEANSALKNYKKRAEMGRYRHNSMFTVKKVKKDYV
jgi:hypothetical protein